MFNGKSIKPSDIFIIETESNKHIMKIVNANFSHKGNYTLEAKNKLGSITCDFEINILSKTITIQNVSKFDCFVIIINFKNLQKS
jgi:hypothetical protein